MNLLLFLVHTVHELMSSQLQSFWIEYLSEKITNTNRTPKWYRILDWTWSSVKDQPQPVRSQTIISCRGVIYATLYDLLINPSKCFSKGCSSLKKKRGGVYDVGFKIWNTKIVEALALSLLGCCWNLRGWSQQWGYFYDPQPGSLWYRGWCSWWQTSPAAAFSDIILIKSLICKGM